MRKLKVWMGNLDGRRDGLVITTSKTKARAIIGRCSAKAFNDYWSEQSDIIDAKVYEAETLYTRPNGGRDPVRVRTWTKGLCEL